MTSTTQFLNPPPINLPNMSIPPPTTPNLSAPPPVLTTISTTTNYLPRFTNNKDVNRGFFKPFRPYHAPKLIPGSQEALQDEFDGKRLRKSVMRKTVDYNSAIIKTLENRIWQRDCRDRRALQPDVIYYPDLLPPPSYIDNPINAVTTRFVKTATNKMRCPIFCMAWTPEGRRLVTGASSGEFTLWNGLTFNFETILQAHDSPVRTMVWSHNESWMVTGDHAGYVKYWQSNMNNVKMFQAHKEAIRGLSFSPTDHKLATCSDDGTVRIYDFLRCHEERILRGHGADVKCVHWHPQKSLVISGSKDNQQPVKLWDPKTGQSLATLHAHKSTVMDVKWNENGNWLITASRDHLLKLFDLRNLNQEVQTFRGHKKEASSVAWHPSHEGLFCSGGSDGAILFWHVGADKEVGAIEQAHDSIVWTLAWHPLGHILCSGSNDHTSKFWTRNRPGDSMRDKYNLNTLPAGTGGIDDHEIADEAAVIPGMGPEDQIIIDKELEEKSGEIPGLDLDHNLDENKKLTGKKVPYSKPIPRNFQAQWNEMESEDTEQVEALNAIVNQLIETTPGAVPLNDVTPNAIILYGKMISVEPGSKLAEAISKGAEAINNLVQAGEVEELRDMIELKEEQEDLEDYLHDEGDIDYSKVPEVDLPAPLASSKFAQNPEFLKVLNRGGKYKSDQLIGWNDGLSDKMIKIHQPAFSKIFSDNSQQSNVDNRCINSLIEKPVSKDNAKDMYDDKYRKSTYVDSRTSDADENNSKFECSASLRSHIQENIDFRISFQESDFDQIQDSYINSGDCIEKHSDDKLQWQEESMSIQKLDDTLTLKNCGINNEIEDNIVNDNNVSNLSNHHNMQNINPNTPIHGTSIHGKSSLHSNNPMTQIMPHHNMQLSFRPNNPPPQMPSSTFNSVNFRPSLGNFHSNVHFRQIGPFVNQNNFNFSGPPPNFRPSNSNYDRGSFSGSSFRNQSPNQNNGNTSSYSTNFSNFSTKPGNSRCGSINRSSNDNNRMNFNNRGRGRENDSLRTPRGRDNY